MTVATDRGELSRLAQQLLDAHHAERPLLLANVWDARSARAVADAGFSAVATSSHAIAELLGEQDEDSTDPDVVFDFTARIARAVQIPVSADLEAGYGLSPAELVTRMLAAGVVGLNFEDSDHHGDGVLLDAERQAERIAAIRSAATGAGVHVVINARIDTFIHDVASGGARIAQTAERARLYLDAGADCVYPIAVRTVADARALTNIIPGPVNLLTHPGGLTVAELTDAGARRISFGGSIFGLVGKRHREILAALAGGADVNEL